MRLQLNEANAGEVLVITEQEEVDGSITSIGTSAGRERKIKVQTPKTILITGEQAIITFTWTKFDPTTKTWLTDPENTDPIQISITGPTGTRTEELDPVNGVDTLAFSSAEPGIHIIKSVNPGADNSYLEVTVANA